MTKARPWEERFRQNYVVDAASGCWLWQGRPMPNGYGRIGLGSRRKGVPEEYAHRASYRLHKGEIPAGMVVMHRCDNRICVNPDHLQVGTAGDNVRDCFAKGRGATGDRNGARKHPDRVVRGERMSAIMRGIQAGEKNSSARLAADQVRAIVDDRRTQDQIAAAYQVSRWTITDIKSGRNWSHVTGLRKRSR